MSQWRTVKGWRLQDLGRFLFPHFHETGMTRAINGDVIYEWRGQKKDFPLIKKDYVFVHFSKLCFQEAESDKLGLWAALGPPAKAEIRLFLVLTETFWQKLGPTNQKCGQDTALSDRLLKVWPSASTSFSKRAHCSNIYNGNKNSFDQQEEIAYIHTVKIRFSKTI